LALGLLIVEAAILGVPSDGFVGATPLLAVRAILVS
jgi:hypothetical protein